MLDYIYAAIPILAIVIHLILNYDMLPGRKVSHIRCAREYQAFLGGLLYYYVRMRSGVFSGDWAGRNSCISTRCRISSRSPYPFS